MNKDELLRLLDLAGKEGPPADDGLSITASPPAPKATSASPTALMLDDWGLRRGEDLLQGNERMRTLGLGPPAVADFHAAAFEPSPRLNDDCTDPARHAFLAQLLETPDYQVLHGTTALHEAASEIAAVAFAEQFAALKKEGEKGKDAGDAEMDTLRAVGRALVKATEGVGELGEGASALGLGPGSPGSNDARAVAALFKQVRNNPSLRRICSLAGRYRRVAQSKQRQKASHGMDDVVGVVLDGDVGRLLPHELARLALPELELDTMRRLVERQTICREYRGLEPVAKGPVIVAVDESGSMEGHKVETAKALALALA